MIAKYCCVLDFETTGLDPHEGAEPIELAAIMLELETLTEVSRFPARLIRIEHPELASQAALDVNKKTLKQLEEHGEDPKVVFAEFIIWASKYLDPTENTLPNYKRTRIILAGHNVKFDINFLKHSLKKYTKQVNQNSLSLYDYIFDYHDICTFSIGYSLKVLLEKSMSKGSLTNFTEYYNIPHDPHQAMSDVEATVEVLRKLFSEIHPGYTYDTCD